MNVLLEDNRTQLLSKSKKADNYVPSNQALGKNRYQRRVRSSVARSVQQYNSIDMNKLFKNNILDVNIEVQGETDKYIVTISFGGFLDFLHDQLKHTNNILDLRTICRALISAFNSDNVYIKCTCPDWKYRMAYWASKNDIITGPQENRPSDITNPVDTKGPGCKHVLLVLSNTVWLIKVASVINNYIKYMQKYREKLYADIIYPAVYEKEYTDEVQLDLFSDNDLETDVATLNKSNQAASSRFKSGNTIGKDTRFKSANKPYEKQVSFDDLVSD